MYLGAIADDFTGATDLANVLTKGGLSAVQLNGIDSCTVANANRVKDHDAIIVALKSRSCSVDEAVSHSCQALKWLQEVGCEKFFFKYCSTFDSTDEGNIGPVADALLERLGEEFTIACPAAPENGRTVYQGHLFVGAQLLSETGMRHHPITPMTDANLVRVLSRQTSGKVGLLPHATVNAGAAEAHATLRDLQADGNRFAIADAVNTENLETLARASNDLRLLTGGSGLAVGLPALMRDQGAVSAQNADLNWPHEGKSLIISGSCSHATNEQVRVFSQNNRAFHLDPERLAEDPERVIQEALSYALQDNDNPALIFSTAPPDKLSVTQQNLGQDQASELIEEAMADIAKRAVMAGVRKLVVAGGETSGAVVSALSIEGLAIGPEIAPGVPWTLSLNDPRVALALKSGNFGGPDFFTNAFETLPR
ncbi:MAG: 3-oxo-tetronate kinase [Hyphomicrobiales bacterium]